MNMVKTTAKTNTIAVAITANTHGRVLAGDQTK